MPRAATGYRSLLRTPGAAAFFFTAAAGRVGIAMTGLGLVWLLHARTGSYGTAGLAAAGFALAEALVGPQLARLVDRFGQTRVLPFCLLAHGAAIACVLTSTIPAAQIAAATCAGAVVPQLGALSGARWAHLLRGERTDELATAFALESLANATAFLLGPVLVTSLGAVGDAALASAIAAGLILGGGAALAAQRRTAPRPARERAGHARSGRTLLRPAFLLLALLNLAIGLFFGTMGVSVSSFATGHGVAGRGRRDHRRRRSQRAALRLGLRAAPPSRLGTVPARRGVRLPDGRGAAASPRAVGDLARRGGGSHGGGGTAHACPAERPHREGRPPGGAHPGVHLEQLRQCGWLGRGGFPRWARRGRVGCIRRSRAGPCGRARPPRPRARLVPRRATGHPVMRRCRSSQQGSERRQASHE